MKKFVYIIAFIVYILLPQVLMSYEWELGINVFGGDGEWYNTLIIGTDRDGSYAYDIGIDIPTFAPPGGFYAYFPLHDTLQPHISMLAKDIRSESADSLLWIIRHAGDTCTASKAIEWESEFVPGYLAEDHYIFVGANYPGLGIDHWYPMDTMECFEFLDAQEVHIRYNNYSGIETEHFTLLNSNIMIRPFPNPFNISTNIEYYLPEMMEVEISIFDVLGHKIIDLDSGLKVKGVYNLKWRGLDRNGNELGSGVYFCRITANLFTKTVKIIIIK